MFRDMGFEFVLQMGIHNASTILDHNPALLKERSLLEVKNLVHLLNLRCDTVIHRQSGGKDTVLTHMLNNQHNGAALTQKLLELDPSMLTHRLNTLSHLLSNIDGVTHTEEYEEESDYSSDAKHKSLSSMAIEQCKSNLIRCSGWGILMEEPESGSSSLIGGSTGHSSHYLNKLNLLIQILKHELDMNQSEIVSVIGKCPWIMTRDINFILITLRELEQIFEESEDDSDEMTEESKKERITRRLRDCILKQPLCLSVSLFHLKKLSFLIREVMPQPQCLPGTVLKLCPSLISCDLERLKMNLLHLTKPAPHSPFSKHCDSELTSVVFRECFDHAIINVLRQCPNIILLKSEQLTRTMQCLVQLLADPSEGESSSKHMCRRIKELGLYGLFEMSENSLMKRREYLNNKHHISDLHSKPQLWITLTLQEFRQIDTVVDLYRIHSVPVSKH